MDEETAVACLARVMDRLGECPENVLASSQDMLLQARQLYPNLRAKPYGSSSWHQFACQRVLSSTLQWEPTARLPLVDVLRDPWFVSRKRFRASNFFPPVPAAESSSGNACLVAAESPSPRNGVSQEIIRACALYGA